MKEIDKFKECYLPYRCYSEEENEVVIMQVNTLLDEVDVYDDDYLYLFEDYTRSCLVYDYEIKYRDCDDKEASVHLIHCHKFEDVIKDLYQFPESFRIPSEYLDEYSKQELIYIKRLKNFFKLIKLKDLDYGRDEEDWLARCKNLKVLEYQNFGYIELEDFEIEKLLKNKEIDLKYNCKLNDYFFERKQIIINKNQDFIAIGKANKKDKYKENNEVTLVLSEKI